MKLASTILGVLGLLAFLLALYGRFFGPSIVGLIGDRFSSLTLLQTSTVFFSMGIFARLFGMKQ